METELHKKTIIFCSAIILAVCGVLWDKLFFVIPILLIFTGISLYKKFFDKIFALILIFFFLFTVLYTYTREPQNDKLTYYDTQNIELHGKISDLPSISPSGKLKFAFDVTEIIDANGNEKLLNAKTEVYLPPDNINSISRGDNLRMKANINVPKCFSNEGEFDYGKYLSNSRIYTLAFADNFEKLNTSASMKDKALKFIDITRNKIISEHKKYLSESEVQILGGVVFGSEAIKPSGYLKSVFIDSGLYHLLAASGMNVAFIFGIWFFILIRLKVPYKFIIISGGIVVLFYAFMTGLPPSVTRATWMIELALLGKLLDRNADNNVLLLFICMILLIYDPLMLNDIGFLLSFVVTFGLINCTKPLTELFKFLPPKISGWFIVPFIAQIFAIPVQMYYFQTISVYSILANMLVIPFMALISFCGFISSILALIPKLGSYICLILDKINEPFLKFMLFVAEKFSQIPNNIAHVAKLNYIEIFLYYILIFLLIYMIKNKFKNIKITVTATLIIIYLSLSIGLKGYSDDLSFTFLNVGEADSIFIKTPNNKKILVDTGKTYGKIRNSATSVILPFFKANGINAIDILLLTHPDTDHIAGSIDILEDIKVGKIYTNGEKAENLSYLKLKDYFKNTKKQEFIINKKQEISPDKDVSIIAIKPDNTDKNSQNDTSLILLIKYKHFDGILMGDNEINSYDILKANYKPSGKTELFKAGHHGSEISVNKEMADLISPEVTVISVGNNDYGHPSPNVFSCLDKSRIYRTDTDKTIKIRTDGNKFNVYTYNFAKSRWQKDNRKP